MHPRFVAKNHPEQIAAIMGDGISAITYQELEIRANRGAHFFRSAGLQNHDVIALWLTNRTEFFELYWAAQRCGLYIVPLSTQLSADEAAYIVNDSGAKLLICDGAIRSVPELSSRQSELIANTKILALDHWEAAIETFSSSPIADEMAGNQMVYSSGTTGQPKGIKVALSGTPAVTENPRTKALSKKYGFDEHSVLLTPAPLYHTAPLIFSTIPQRLGSKIVVMRKFDPEKMLQWIEQHRITFVQMVPTMFIRLLKLPKDVRERYDLSSLKTVLHAAAPCPIDVKRDMLDWLGPIIYEYYAGSEGNGTTSIGSEEWLRKPGSVGKAGLGTVHICDENGTELPTGETGLIYFEGGNKFEYLNDPNKTANARNPLNSGWTSLGDIGHLDEDGYLYLTDRKSFMIISGGVNIYPQETENLLIQHPEVADVAVIGVPNTEMGEEVKAVVQPVCWDDRGENLAERLMSHCRDKMSHLKCPKSVDFERQLPRHENGKLYKQQLKEHYWSKPVKV